MKPITLINNGKVCSKCGEWKPIEEYWFNPNRDREHKHLSHCRNCHSLLMAIYRQRTKKPCPICGIDINKSSKYCRRCYHKTEEYLEKRRGQRKKTRKENRCVDCGVLIGPRGKRCARCKLSGERNPGWNGGQTILKDRIRDLMEYRQWRSDVFTRDSFSCRGCGQTGHKIHAHHEIPLNVLIQKYEITNIDMARDCAELWNINNGVTLCINCHADIHKKRGYKNEHCQH
jgi:hypothetical protein